MIITNVKKIEQKMYLIISGVALNFLFIFYVFLVVMKNFDVAISISILLQALLILVLTRLKCLHFENSGEVITIKIYHPLRKQKINKPTLEIPKHCLSNFYLDFRNHTLTLNLENPTEKSILKTFKVSDLSQKQLAKMTILLENE